MRMYMTAFVIDRAWYFSHSKCSLVGLLFIIIIIIIKAEVLVIAVYFVKVQETELS